MHHRQGKLHKSTLNMNAINRIKSRYTSSPEMKQGLRRNTSGLVTRKGWLAAVAFVFSRSLSVWIFVNGVLVEIPSASQRCWESCDVRELCSDSSPKEATLIKTMWIQLCQVVVKETARNGGKGGWGVRDLTFLGICQVLIWFWNTDFHVTVWTIECYLDELPQWNSRSFLASFFFLPTWSTQVVTRVCFVIWFLKDHNWSTDLVL